MQSQQLTYSANRWWSDVDASTRLTRAQLVLVFGDRPTLAAGDYLAPLRVQFPTAQVVSCSSGGDVLGASVSSEGLVATAVRFEECHVTAVEADIPSMEESETTGAQLAARLPAYDLRHVLVFAEGLHVNGSALAKGLSAHLPRGVSVTGGLAADGDRFERTLVGLNAVPGGRRAVAIGIYGAALKVGMGTFGGWEAFGDVYQITRSKGNVLQELDGRKALELYKALLGPMGYALPASGLLFPLKIRETNDGPGVVRTILGVNEEEGSVTFAGDIPEGWSARLVRTGLDELIHAAGIAGGRAADGVSGESARLALAVSCIGRKLLLQQRTREELARVQSALGGDTTLSGFYSYGELAPSSASAECDLHNQTMTVTLLSEG